MRTRTGNFRIGFRGGWTDWQKDHAGMARWAKSVGFELIDVGAVEPGTVKSIRDAGVDCISVDLHSWPALTSPDDAKRAAAIDKSRGYIEQMTELGIKVFFAVVIPEKPDDKPIDNFKRAVASFGELATAAENAGATIVLEGWPGMHPHYGNFCCNPETYRAILKEVPSKGLSVNFDPSHLIRMGVDHVRFIDEFADRVGHVHGKDTEILTNDLYEIGLYQQSSLKEPVFAGEYAWRYTIPGHGLTRWSYCFEVLKRVGFDGAVCVELEDANYNGSEQGEKAGLTASLAFLASA